MWWSDKKTHKYTNVFDILRENDFYQLKPLNKIELYLLRHMFIETKEGDVLEANENIYGIATTISSVSEFVGEVSEFKDLQIQDGELFQSTFEKMGIESLSHLLSEDVAWLDSENNMADFIVFLLVQYFRTKTMKENTMNAMNPSSSLLINMYKKEFNDSADYSINWDNIYNYGHLCLAHRAALGLLSKKFRFKLLKTKKANFIVSDQPVYNIGDNSVNEFILFYPLSPKLALLGASDIASNCIVEIEDNEALFYNYNTLKHTLNFFMGKEEKDVVLFDR